MASEDAGDKFKIFYDLWNGSKTEIFRLQLLNTYWEDTQLSAFKDFMDGKSVDYLNSPGYKEFADDLATARGRGVDIINLQVLDLPLSDALRFGLGFLRLSEKNGQRTLFVERKDVVGIVRGLEDYYLFDLNTILPIVYDKKDVGRFIEYGDPISRVAAAKYIAARDALEKVAIPMEGFLIDHNIDTEGNRIKRRLKSF